MIEARGRDGTEADEGGQGQETEGRVTIMSTVKACPVCGRLVLHSCYHNGADIQSIVMTPELARSLRVATYRVLQSEAENLIQDGDITEYVSPPLRDGRTEDDVMGIEARGAKHAYVYMLLASKITGNAINSESAMIFDVADSDDAAFGRAMKSALRWCPPENGWTGHCVGLKKISGIDWVGPHYFDEIEPMN